MADTVIEAQQPVCKSNVHQLGAQQVSSQRRTTVALIGYARVSTGDQTLDLQRDALREAGCIDIYEEYCDPQILHFRPTGACQPVNFYP